MHHKTERRDRSKWVGLSASVLITLAVLWPTLENDWTNWDDPFYVITNPLVRHLSIGQIKEIFSTLQVQGIYHPLTMLSFAVDFAISGLEPATYHTTNLILHALNVGLVFWFTHLLSGSTNVAVVSAILFGIHPMHLESVAWVSARKDVLYSFFFMSGLIAYLHFLKSHRHLLGLYLLCLILFTLSLLSKGMAVTFPLTLLCIDFLFRRRPMGRVLLEKVPFLILSIGFGLLAVIAQQSGSKYLTIYSGTFWLLISLGISWHIPEKMVQNFRPGT